jgi:hypothetical protein
LWAEAVWNLASHSCSVIPCGETVQIRIQPSCFVHSLFVPTCR